MGMGEGYAEDPRGVRPAEPAELGETARGRQTPLLLHGPGPGPSLLRSGVSGV